MRKFNKILIYRCGALGDTLVALPVLNALRRNFPKSIIYLMTQSNTDGILWPDKFLSDFNVIDAYLLYKNEDLKDLGKIFTLITKVRRLNFDLVINLPNDKASPLRLLRDRFFFKIVGCKKYASANCEKVNLLGKIKKKAGPFPKESERLISVLKHIDITDLVIDFNIPRFLNEMTNVESFVKKNFMVDTKFITVCPGSKMPVKKWPVNNFIQVCINIYKDLGLKICLIGGEEDIPVCNQIKDSMPINSCAVAAGLFSVAGSTELIRRSEFYLGNDTGAMHLAASVGKTCVALFSGRDSASSWHPWGDQHVCIYKQVPCSPCMKTDCDTLECLNLISPDEVFSACKKVLDKLEIIINFE